MDINGVDNLTDEQILELYNDILEVPDLYLSGILDWLSGNYCYCSGYHTKACLHNHAAGYYITYSTDYSCK